MPDEAATPGYREQVRALGARLASLSAAREMDALKREIGMLFRAVDQDVRELTAIRDDVKQLIEHWKVLHDGPAAPSNAPEFPTEKPVVHADHIGASTYVEKGWSRLSLGDPAGAEEALRRADELSPGSAQTEALLGWALMLQEKYDDALLMFQKVLMREPQNSLARINVGYICLKKRIFGEAIEHLSRAIRLNNDRKATLYAHFYLGLVYLERDMFEDAQTFFQKTLALGPNLIEAHYELGRAYWFNGQREEATATWQAGYAANRFSPWGQRCGEVLKTVEGGGEP